MNRIFTKAGLLAALGLAALGAQAQAPTIDGTRDASYGTALGVQTVNTQYGDATSGSTVSASAGSELDNIHAQIVGSTLYLFIGGNLQNNNNGLAIFFDSKSGGQTLVTGNSNSFLNNYNGLTFDSGFTADYGIDLNRDGASPANFYVNYSDLPTAGSSNSNAYIGNVPGTSRTLNFSASVSGAGTGSVSINNSNVAGVTGGTTAANASNAAAVATGLEFEIPLTALGTSVNAGNIKIMALIRGGNSLSNQTLGGLPAGTNNQGSLSGINFNSFAGNQYVTLVNSTSAQISVNPASLNFGNVGTGSSSNLTFTIGNNGTGSLSVTSISSSNPLFTVSPTTTTVASGGSHVTVTVTFSPTASGPQTSTITIASNDPTTPSTTVSVSGTGVTPQPIIGASPAAQSFNNVGVGSSATRSVTISNTGTGPLNVTNITSSNGQFTVSPTTATVAAGSSTTVTVTFAPTTAGAQTSTLTIASNDPATPSKTVSVSGTAIGAGQVVVDGTVDAALYGPAKALQTSATGFSDGQELDGAYARVTGTDLYLTLAGNLPTNGNKLVIFFDASPAAGQNTFLAANPTVDFGNSANLAGLRFDRGFLPESFLSLNSDGTNLYANYALMNGGGGNGSYVSASTAFSQTLTFSGGATGELALNNSNAGGVDGANVNSPGTVTTGVELRIPLSVLGAGITSTTPLHVMAIIVNDQYNYLSNQTLGGLPVGTANLTSLAAINATDFLNFLGNQFFTAQRGDVTVSGTSDLAGDYNSITVASTGVAQVYSPLNVATALTDQGSLIFQPRADAIVTGPGTTTISGSVAISSVAGITSSGATGNVQTTGRVYSPGAQYAYINVANGVTGNGLPGTVAALGVGAIGNVTLSQPVSIAAGLALSATGNLVTNGQALTLLSSAAGTALVVNSGTGIVNGAATVQRYIDPSVNPGPGYRHYAAPVSNTTVADLATGGFSPVVNPAYNTSPTPTSVTPFPTVQGYDESRVTTATNNLSAFDKGFFSPGALSDPLPVGMGYTVNIAAAQKVDFVGSLNNNTITRTLPRNGGAAGGWHMVGNPYPAPLDYSLVAPADRPGLDAAVYVFESSSQYGGAYRAYVPGGPVTTANNPIIASSQGFWVRTSTVGGTGTLTFRNSQRVTSAATASTLRRDAPDARPVLVLALAGDGNLRDALTVYADAQATAGVDAQHDAVKLPNSSGLNLAALAAGTELAINGRPALAPGLVLPLALRVPGAGTYTLTAPELRNLGGLPVYLRDAGTGQQVLLTAQAAYRFTVTAAQAAALGTGRFSLVFAPAGALATGAALAANAVSLYPNPAHGTATLLVPAVAGATQVQAGLYNALGQRVRQYPAAALPAAGASATLDVSGLSAGLYTLRLTAGSSTISKKLAVE